MPHTGQSGKDFPKEAQPVPGLSAMALLNLDLHEDCPL